MKGTENDALETPPRRIAVAIDGSDYSMKAAEVAIALRKKTGANLVALNVIDISSVFRVLPQTTKKELIMIGRQQAKKIFEHVVRIAEKHGVDIQTEIIESSNPAADALINYAKEKKIDLIVVGTKGRSGMKKALLGSVASKVVTYSPCAVLVVR